jgi:hypothetical protein
MPHLLEAPRFSVDEVIDRELAAGIPFGPFHQWWLMERAPEKVKRNLELARLHPELVGARQGFQSMDINDGVTAAFSARNTSASELNMLGDTINSACPQAIINQYCAIPANDARAGKVYELKLGGVYGNTGTPTVIFTPRWGSSTTPATNISLGANAAYTTISGTTALPYYIEFMLTIRTAPPGATQGTAYGTGIVTLGIPSTGTTPAVTTVSVMIGNTAATIDTTGQGAAGCGLTMNLTWSASSASNTSTCQWWLLTSLN